MKPKNPGRVKDKKSKRSIRFSDLKNTMDLKKKHTIEKYCQVDLVPAKVDLVPAK